MLDHLKKFFNPAPAETQAQAEQEEVVTMNEEDKQTLAAAELKTADMSAALESATATLAGVQEQMKELTSKYEAAQAALEASEAAQKELATQAAAKRLEARTEAIKAAVGSEKVEALLAVTDGMGDEQFNVLVSAMAASFDAEEKTEMFVESGVAAETVVVDEKPTHFKQYINK